MSTTSTMLKVTNPYDQSIVAEIPYDTTEQINAKVAAAAAAQARWKWISLDERIRTVRVGLNRLREEGEKIARAVSLQMGKPLAQAAGELTTLFARAEQIIADAPLA